MKQIVVIDENKGIKNKLPEEYENLEVNFARYYKYEFNYEYNGVLVIASGWDEDVYNAELLAKETVGTIFREAPWQSFVIIDRRFDSKNSELPEEKHHATN